MSDPRRLHRPHWWPEEEPWPPRAPRRFRGGHGRRFVWRAAMLFALVVTLSAVGAVSVTSLLVGSLRGIPPLLAMVVVLAAAVVILRLYVAGVSRVGMPLGDIVEASERLAAGDYAARVASKGPPFLRRIAQAFNTMADRLQANDRQRRDLMADVAHELRTPLAVVQGKLEGLLDGVYPRDDRQIEELIDETRLLSRLVDDLGLLAQSERGALALRREPTDLPALLDDAARAMTKGARGAGVTLRVEAETVPLLMVDPLRMREVLLNLLTNAIRHSPAGSTVSVRAHAAGDTAVVEVRDDGSGIAPDDLPRIFDRFHRGSRSTGSGLGLAISKNLVEAHGGTIAAESTPGQGTTVRVTVPLDA